MLRSELIREVAIVIAGDIVLSEEPGKRMRYWREYFSVSQSELASRMGTIPSVLSDYESGRRKSPGAHFIRKFVEALIAVDQERGGRVLRELMSILLGVSPSFRDAVIDMREFTRPLTVGELAEVLSGTLHVGEEYRDQHVYGYTIVDGLKLVLEVPSFEYLRLYGRTTQRAAIFTNIRYGRSPLVAIKAMMAVTGIRPAVVVLHGIERPDPLGVEIAKREGIPLITCTLPLTEMVERLRRYCHA